MHRFRLRWQWLMPLEYKLWRLLLCSNASARHISHQEVSFLSDAHTLLPTIVMLLWGILDEILCSLPPHFLTSCPLKGGFLFHNLQKKEKKNWLDSSPPPHTHPNQLFGLLCERCPSCYSWGVLLQVRQTIGERALRWLRLPLKNIAPTWHKLAPLPGFYVFEASDV